MSGPHRPWCRLDTCDVVLKERVIIFIDSPNVVWLQKRLQKSSISWTTEYLQCIFIILTMHMILRGLWWEELWRFTVTIYSFYSFFLFFIAIIAPVFHCIICWQHDNKNTPLEVRLVAEKSKDTEQKSFLELGIGPRYYRGRMTRLDERYLFVNMIFSKLSVSDKRLAWYKTR